MDGLNRHGRLKAQSSQINEGLMKKKGVADPFLGEKKEKIGKSNRKSQFSKKNPHDSENYEAVL